MLFMEQKYARSAVQYTRHKMNSMVFWVIAPCSVGKPDASEEHIASNFSVEQQVRQETKHKISDAT
jgi:hypothetical protein